MSPSLDSPVYAVPEPTLVPVGDYLNQLTPIPPSRMFLINKSLSVYRQANPGGKTFDASQGDGGASLDNRSAQLRNVSPDSRFLRQEVAVFPWTCVVRRRLQLLNCKARRSPSRPDA